MKDINWNSRKQKTTYRDYFFQNTTRKQHLVTLAGAQSACVDTAKKLQIISPERSFVTAVERDRHTFNEMKKWFVKNWKPNAQQLENEELHNVCEIRPVDLLFLDFLGNPTAEDAFWIKNIIEPKLLPNAQLGMTVSKAIRNNHFIKGLIKLLDEKFHARTLQTAQEVRDTQKYDSSVVPLITAYILFFDCYVLNGYTFELTANQYGEEGSPHVMVLFKLTEIQKCKHPTSEEDRQIQKAISEFIGVQKIAKMKHYVEELNEPTTQTQTQTQTPTPKETMINTQKNTVLDAYIRATQPNATPGQKAYSTRLINELCERQKELGKNPVMVIAGIKAHAKRRQNEAEAQSRDRNKPNSPPSSRKAG